MKKTYFGIYKTCGQNKRHTLPWLKKSLHNSKELFLENEVDDAINYIILGAFKWKQNATRN